MAPKNFFPQSFFGEAKKKWTSVLHQALLPVFQKDGNDACPHVAVPGLTWEFILFLTSSYIRKRIEKKESITAFCTTCFPFLIGAFPSKGEEEAGWAQEWGSQHSVTVTRESFCKNGKSWSNKQPGPFRHVLLLLVTSYCLE